MRQHQGGFLYYFNSQPHEEADDIVTCHVNVILYFNSQPHEEADVAERY